MHKTSVPGIRGSLTLAVLVAIVLPGIARAQEAIVKAPAPIGIRIPHPTFAKAHASDTAPTEDKLARIESSANIQAMFVGRVSDRVSARLFAGPSYFRIQQDAVGIIRDDQVFLFFSPVNEVAITDYEASLIDFDDGGGWGFNIGGDVNFFFNRVVGLGWFAKHSRGSVEVIDPLSAELTTRRTGGFQTGRGLRLRF